MLSKLIACNYSVTQAQRMAHYPTLSHQWNTDTEKHLLSYTQSSVILC